MSKKQRIITPRVQRELSVYSKAEILDLSEELSEINNSYTPQKRRNVDFTILSCREVALAHRNSPDDSLLKTLSSDEYQSMIAQKMHSNTSFNKPLNVNIKQTRGERRVDIYEDRGHKFLGIDLESDIFEAERERAVEIMQYLTGVTLENKPVRLILGTATENYDFTYLQEEADELLNSGDFDIHDIEFNEGVVVLDIRTPIIRPRRADQITI